MRQFSINTTLEYLQRISPEHSAKAREFLETLPACWHNAIPRSCRQPDAAVPWHVIAHVLLALIDPAKFPSARRTRRLAEFIHTLLDAAERDTHHQSGKATTMTDEFFPDTADTARAGDELAFLQRSVVGKAEFEATAETLTAALLDEHSALEVYVKIKNIAEILDVALGQIREQAILSLSGTSQEVLGATAQLRPLPRKWEYDDTEVRRLEADKLAVEAQLKARKKYLENLKTEVANTATGEIIRPARCIAESVTIQVTF